MTLPSLKRAAWILIALIAYLGMCISTANAEAAQDVHELSQAEMGTLCGGFMLPNGISIDIGVDNQLSINGQSVADANFSINGTSVRSSFNGQTQVSGNGGSTNILQMTALGATVIQNTSNFVNLDLLRTINVSVTGANFATNAAAMQLQALNSLRNSVR